MKSTEQLVWTRHNEQKVLELYAEHYKWFCDEGTRKVCSTNSRCLLSDHWYKGDDSKTRRDRMIEAYSVCHPVTITISVERKKEDEKKRKTEEKEEHYQCQCNGCRERRKSE